MKFTCAKYPKLHIGLRIAFDNGVYETEDKAEIASILAFSAKYGIEADSDSLASLFSGLADEAPEENTKAAEGDAGKEEKEEKEEDADGGEDEAGDDESSAFTREDLEAMSVKVIKNHAAVKGILLEGTKKDELIDSFLAGLGE